LSSLTALEDPSPHLVQVYALRALNRPAGRWISYWALRRQRLQEILLDEPDWKDVLRVVPVDLDGRSISAN
jgi:hypothetical protein